MVLEDRLRPGIRHALFAAVCVSYGLVLFFFVRRQPAVMIAVLAPTVVAAYLYALPGGIVVGLCGFLLNLTITIALRDDAVISRLLPGTLMGAGTNVLLGVLVGWNRSLVTRLRNAHETIRKQAATDELTGCCNRRYAYAALEERMAESRRYNMPLAVVYLDLDNLKRTNDSHGHGKGDALIRCLAEHARRTVRETDLVCRMGGDEFLVVLPRCTAECAGRVIQRLRQSFLAAWEHPEQASFSSGVAELEDGDTVDSLIERADRFMYERKRSGRSGRQPDPTPPQ